MIKVLIVQTQMKQYRVPVFLQLADQLSRHGVELRVAYGEPPALQRERKDNVELEGYVGVKVRNRWFAKDRLLVQDVLGIAANADLVIIEQSNLMLTNHLLMIAAVLRRTKLAFWGHGRNLQARRASAGEALKRFLLDKVDWWFAYTQGTATYLEQHGMPKECVTVVQNAVDTETFRRDLEAVTSNDVEAERQRLGVPESAQVLLYCGSLHPDKEIAFLLEAVERVRSSIPDIVLLLIGGGPQQVLLEQLASDQPWVRYLGPKFGKDRAAFFKMACAFLNPGLVGLGVLDAFSAGLPVLTTKYPFHSPEIEYVKDGMNGHVTDFDRQEFANEVIRCLSTPGRLDELSQGALETATEITLDAMVNRFEAGILAALSNPRRSRWTRRVKVGWMEASP